MATDFSKESILKAAMECAAQKGWDKMTLAEIASITHLPLDQIREEFPSKACLLVLLNELADKQALQQILNFDSSMREKLFDLLMSRFDVLQHYRPGIKALMKTLPFNPCLVLWSGAHIVHSMKWMAEYAGIDTSGLKGHIFIKALTATWLYTVRIWATDNTADLSKTMAALDTSLSRLVRLPFATRSLAHTPSTKTAFDSSSYE